MFVDDGSDGRGHRDNILSRQFTHTGVSCGCHTKKGDVCCIMYGSDVKDKPEAKNFDVIRVPQNECAGSKEKQLQVTSVTPVQSSWLEVRSDNQGVTSPNQYSNNQNTGKIQLGGAQNSNGGQGQGNPNGGSTGINNGNGSGGNGAGGNGSGDPNSNGQNPYSIDGLPQNQVTGVPGSQYGGFVDDGSTNQYGPGGSPSGFVLDSPNGQNSGNDVMIFEISGNPDSPGNKPYDPNSVKKDGTEKDEADIHSNSLKLTNMPI